MGSPLGVRLTVSEAAAGLRTVGQDTCPGSGERFTFEKISQTLTPAQLG